MSNTLVDFSYLYEVSSNDPKYIYDIVNLFLENFPGQLIKLEEVIRSQAEWIVIQKQAHSMKSSVLFVKIQGLFDSFYGIEMLARQTTGREQMLEKLESVLATYKLAYPVLIAERDKCNPNK